MNKSLSIKSKTIALVVVIIISISILISLLATFEMNSLSSIQVQQFKQSVYKQKKNELKNYIDIVKNIINTTNNKFGEKGKELAKEEIKNLRYNTNGYFWIHDAKTNKMIMHPTSPSLNGTNLLDLKDSNGNYFYRDMAKIIEEKGEGFVKYMWTKPGGTVPKDKYAYMILYKPWGWVIGTGAYINDIKNTVKSMHEKAKSQEIEIIFKVTLITIFLIILSYIVIIYGFNKLVSKPLNEFKFNFQNFLDFITFKNNRYDYQDVKEKNEISELLVMINNTAKDFDKKLKQDMKVMGEVVLLADKVEQGIYKCRVKSTAQNPMIMTLRDTLNKMLNILETNMVNIKTALNEYSNNDYRKRVDISPKLKEDMLAVIKGVNSLGETLSTSAKTNLKTGETLEENSDFMASSMKTLSTKANEQAANLEETAAAVEEITSITRTNTENASKMAKLGDTVKSAVNTGQSLANKTASSMEEINSEVNAINEAITIIDQIAFQTNILSLNAAVEAATAGEAGKGFAVVAAEVRNLASRSAEAASEIKDLVEKATNKADEGKNISNEMIKGYEQLNTQINETIKIIDDVSVASKEQMTGIEQINNAITALDKVTQENANETSQVNNITLKVSQLAKDLVSDAQSKKFN